MVASSFVAPVAIGALAFPKPFGTILIISYQSGSPRSLTTCLSKALLTIPSLAYLAFELRNDFGFVAMLALLLIALLRGIQDKDSSLLIPAVRLFGLLIASPQDYAAWRFALEAILPLTILAGYGLHSIMPQKTSKTKRLRSGDPYRFGVIVLGVFFLAPMLVPGWATTLACGFTQGASENSSEQRQITSAMSWLALNPPSRALLTVTDPLFIYSNVVIHRNSTYAYFGNSSQAQAFARLIGAEYIVVTRHDVFCNLLTPARDDSSSSLPWYTYSSTQTMVLVYDSTDVRIFFLNPSP